YWRNGKSETVSIDLGTLPKSDERASAGDQDSQQQAEPSSLADLGLTVTPADDGKGIVVTDVDPDSDAADRGIQPGDVITTVNARAVSDASDVTKAMDDAAKAGRKAVLMQVTREDTNRFVALPIGRG
ncbi:MAG: PDZ domain-containing protein, partial [Mesorhizobium sp.]|nr:PDZ domain-containing protein [Mesorhizobium sp.]